MINGGETPEKSKAQRDQSESDRHQSDKKPNRDSENLKGCMSILGISLFQLINLIFAGLLFFASLSTFIAICVQAWIYTKQLEQMRISTGAATQAAKAAENSVTLARENAHLEQRAWVAIGQITGIPEVGKPFRITVSIQNTGKTFAKAFKMIPVVHIQNEIDEPDFDALEEKMAQERGPLGVASSVLLPPNAVSSATIECVKTNLTQEEFDKFRSGRPRVWVFGKMSYLDIFKCEHWTSFCSFLAPTGDKWDYMSYDKHNDCDNNRCPN